MMSEEDKVRHGCFLPGRGDDELGVITSQFYTIRMYDANRSHIWPLFFMVLSGYVAWYFFIYNKK
jgi:hypothetical protein